MDELKFQARIVKEVLNKKGWARKIGNPQQAGTPDLFIKVYTLDPVLVECKLNKLNLTAIQRNCINNLQRANMHTGWLVLQQERTIYNCFVGADPDAIQPVANDNCTLITFSGKEWDIGEIVKAVLYWSDREMDKHG